MTKLAIYVGAPVSHRRRERPRLTASCGRDVWVDLSWWRVKTKGKRLICLDCAAAIAAEHSALLVIYRRGYQEAGLS